MVLCIAPAAATGCVTMWWQTLGFPIRMDTESRTYRFCMSVDATGAAVMDLALNAQPQGGDQGVLTRSIGAIGALPQIFCQYAFGDLLAMSVGVTN